MLVDQSRLNSALENVVERNSLISELFNIPLSDDNGIAARALAIWLGDNAGLEKADWKDVIPNPKSYLMAGYHFFLLLDLLSMMSVERNDQLHLNINEIRQQCFEFFNQHHQQLQDNPAFLFSQFHRILQDNHVVKSGYNLPSIYRNAFEECQQLLINANDLLFQLKKNVRKSIDVRSRLINLSRQTTSFISCANSNYLYFQDSILTNLGHKVFVQSDDSVMLDALYLKNTLSPKKTLVIALVGHFQVEHHYLASALEIISNLFDEDTLFINHRNYAVRSARMAVNARELSDDVVAFFKHYRDQYENIVLYGMCGGAAIMILAAESLTKENLKYKLVVDRFFSQYNNTFDTKTVMRARQVVSTYPEHDLLMVRLMRSPLGFLILMVMFSLFAAIARLLLLLSHNDMNFGNIIASLPAEDVLVLQVKGMKQPGKPTPLYTDLFVHPENDLRKAVKPRRHDTKIVFKQLRDNAMSIIQECVLMPSQNIVKLLDLFLNMHVFFNAILQLIDNEKLMGLFESLHVKDLHSSYLNHLATRHHLPLRKFLHGFFASPTGKMNNSLSQLKKFSRADILSLLAGEDWPQASAFDESRDRIADAMAAFFEGCIAHHRLIAHYGHRLYSSGINHGDAFENLIKSNIYQSLQSHADREVETHDHKRVMQ